MKNEYHHMIFGKFSRVRCGGGKEFGFGKIVRGLN